MTAEDKRKTDAAQRAQVYTLKITPLHARGVHRTIELLGSHSLADLHAFMEEEFALAGGAPWAFFLSEDPNDPGHGPHQQAAQRGPRARLSTLGLKPERRFRYAYDYEEDPLQAQRHQLEVLALGPAQLDEGDYPRVIESVGAPPPPPGEEPPPELAADLAPLAQEIGEAVAAFEEAELEDEPRTRKQVLADAKLLRRMAQAVAGRPEQVRAIEHASDAPLFDWVSDVPFALADKGLANEAEALCRELGAVCYPSTLLGARAMILARAGRKDEALAQVRDNLAQTAKEAATEDGEVDLEVLDQSAEVLVELGELVQAEALTRQVLAALEDRFKATLEEDDEEDEEDDEDDDSDALLYGDALQRLAQILRRCGRTKEAQAVEVRLREHAERMEQMMELEDQMDLFNSGFPVPPDMLEAFIDLEPEPTPPKGAAKKKGK